MFNSARDWLLDTGFSQISAIQLYRDRRIFVDLSLQDSKDQKESPRSLSASILKEFLSTRHGYDIVWVGELWYLLWPSVGKLTLMMKDAKTSQYAKLILSNCPVRILAQASIAFDHQAAQAGEQPWR